LCGQNFGSGSAFELALLDPYRIRIPIENEDADPIAIKLPQNNFLILILIPNFRKDFFTYLYKESNAYLKANFTLIFYDRKR
jgi:hypothetical protein